MCSLGTYLKMTVASIQFRMKQTYFVLVVSTAIAYVEAGECCKAYVDLSFTSQPAKWCSGYCCGSAAIGILECCDTLLLQAPADERTSFCIQWFASNVWAPILIALGGVGIIVFCCVCCYAMFCRSSTRVGTVVAPLPQSNIVMMSGAQGTGPQPIGQFPTGSHPVGQYSQGPPPVGQYSQGPPPVGQYSQGPPPVGQYSQGPPPVGQYSQGPPPVGQHPLGPPSVEPFSQNDEQTKKAVNDSV